MQEINMPAKGGSLPAGGHGATGGKKIIIAQFIILLAGTIFAWTNFTIELINWLNKRACTTGCVVGLVNPFLTPCFYGAIFFTLAFILSAIILKKNK